MKETFIVKTAWGSVFDDLSDAQAGALIKAIFSYEAEGEKPKITDPAVKMAFKFVCLDLDVFDEKYRQKCKTNRENGAKGAEYGQLGGRPKKSDKTPENPERGYENPENPERPLTDTDNDNDNDNENKNGKREAANAAMRSREKSFHDSLISYISQYGKEMIREFYNYWTEPNKSGTKMKFELQQTWDTARRLATWANKQSDFKPRQTSEEPKKPLRML